jgi:cytochrome c biogenesis protein CcmG, thiol:disulfide interchange protein DsbE
LRRAWRAWPRARWAVVAGAVVAVIVVVEVASGGGNSSDGRMAPPLPTKSLQAPAVSLSTLRGKPALIDFFASWCVPCHEEAPALHELSESIGDKANVVAVDWDDAGGSARAFIKKYGWKFPVLADTKGTTGEKYGFIGLPTSFVIDPRGKIVATFRGPQSVATLRRALLEAA